jgi:hypothetical protein
MGSSPDEYEDMNCNEQTEKRHSMEARVWEYLEKYEKNTYEFEQMKCKPYF